MGGAFLCLNVVLFLCLTTVTGNAVPRRSSKESEAKTCPEGGDDGENVTELTCGENEEINECPNECDDDLCPIIFEIDTDISRNCVNPVECEPNPKCQCMEDYRRNSSGSCIPIKDCPTVCSDNEIYSNCTQSVCRAQFCYQSGRQVPCPNVKQGSCEQGCVCKEGYLRNQAGNCVLESLCGGDLDCDINEEVNYCPRVCDNENCPKNLGSGVEQKCNKYNGVCQTPKCSCIRGYARDPSANGTCIPIPDCPGVCPVNEEYSNCTESVCRAQKCSEYGKPVKCRQVKKGNCQQGCVCKEGYLRNSAGDCVLADLCGDDLECDINEEVNYCPRACDDETCPENLGSGDEPKCNKYNGVCLTPKCSCIKNYARDPNANGACIPIQDCPDVCPDDEEYTNCTQSVCRAQFCYQSGRQVPCPKVKPGSCKQGCVCKEGYLRNQAGNCVLESLCGVDLDCDVNEEVNYCPRVCDNENCPENLGSGAEPKCNKYNGVCQTPKCSCIRGYARDPSANGTCIPIPDCPDVCPENEEYSNCTESICRAQKCNQYGRPVPCRQVKKGNCQQGCVCKEGYLRNSVGECVLVDLCGDDLECDINEEVNYCPRACDDETCPENLGSGEEQKCNKYNGVCQTPKCSCIKGYARDPSANGTCIPITDCPGVCPVNEEYSNCTESVCRAQKCNEYGKPVKCRQVKKGNCQQGCVCKEGYLRNSAGDCVLADLCGDDLECDINEEVNYCPRACDDETCPENLGSGDEPKCNKYNGVCLTPKCSCIKNYARDPNANGACIPIQDCPDVCPDNEEYSNCTQSVCRAQFCYQSGRQVPCPKVKPGSCKQGCVCKEGYLRNEAGNCVLESLCGVDLDCDINEEVNYCPRVCDNENCPKILGSGVEPKCNKYNGVCQTPKCSCIRGYARDPSANGTCIPIPDCPDVCPQNEEYSNCTESVCRAQKCNEYGRPVPCRKVKKGSCQQGCVCKEGYLRNSAGECVLVDLCGDDLECDINEEVNYCPRACDDETCPENLGSGDEPKCNKYNGVCLTPKCSCIKNYARDPNANGACIPIQDCPNVCPNNEEYSNCTQSVCRAQYCDQSGTVSCTKIKQGSCQQGCVCKEGYLRNKAGDCVLKDECGERKPQCNLPNEESQCVKSCPPERICQNHEITLLSCLSDDKPCEQKCVCKKGYLRSITGYCIREEDCVKSRCSDPNEEFVNCKRNCPADLCSSLVESVDCEGEPYEPGCACKPGFLRKKTGAPCMPICDCPQMRNSTDCRKPKPTKSKHDRKDNDSDDTF